MNRKCTLVRVFRLGSGWRRGKAVLLANGRIRHPFVLVGGKPVAAPNGKYQMLRYVGRTPVYIDLSNDPADALARYKVERAKHEMRCAATEAGLEMVPPEQSKKKADEKTTLAEYAANFIEMHGTLPHRSDDSVRVYTMVTSTFLAQCPVEYPEQVSREHIIRWHGWMRQQGYSDRTAADRYASLRGFLRYAGIDPAKVIDRGTHTLLHKYTKRAVDTYTPETVAALIAASADSNRALLWETAYKTGLRDSELQHLTRHDLHRLDTDSPTLTVRERDSLGRIKDSEERTVELEAGLAGRLKIWLDANPGRQLVFGTVSDRPDTKMLFSLKATARRAGLNCGRCDGCKGPRKECRDFTLHRFRRTYTSAMLRATGGDLRSVMARTGHSDITSVMRYLAPQAAIREAVARAF